MQKLKMASFFCSLCEKDCYFRSKFDRQLRSTSHKLQEDIQKITSESRKRSAPCTTLELASAGAVDYETETATDAQALVGICIRSTYILFRPSEHQFRLIVIVQRRSLITLREMSNSHLTLRNSCSAVW